ncbi:phage protein [Dialister sp. CAG:588]|nr:phage protein [Dialister sp. CAG:588]
MIDVDTLKDSEEFEVLLGYINTLENKQLKGDEGSVK